MTIYLILLSFSGLGSIFIIVKNYLKFNDVFEEEAARHITLQIFFREFENHIAAPIKNFLETKFVPLLFKKTEKISHQARIYILKIENKLLKFNNYVKGKRQIKENGNASEYVQKLNGFKNNGESEDSPA